MGKNKKILFITAFHPGGKGVIGAGEAICEDSLRALQVAGTELHVLSLAPPNQSPNIDVVSLCRSYRTLSHTLGQAWLGILYGFAQGSALAPWFFTRASRRNIQASLKIAEQHGIDEVWLDFPPTLAFARHFHEMEIDYFVHDVITQKVGRSPIFGFLKSLVCGVEKRLMSHVKRSYVLSRKDKNLLMDMGFNGEILIRPPSQVRIGEVVNGMPVSRILIDFGGRKNLVFFGNMKRAANHWSVMHFLLFLYPKIRRRHTDVQFWVIGLSPRMTLRILGYLTPGVRVVGAIDDPTPAFVGASLCVVPLRLGAGVKIKVLQMLDAGAIVVSSPVGAEGISATRNLFVVPYEGIPDAVCSILSNNQRIK